MSSKLAHLIITCLLTSTTCWSQQSYTIEADPENESQSTSLHENRFNLLFLADGFEDDQTGIDLINGYVDDIIYHEFDVDNNSNTPDVPFGFKSASPYKEYLFSCTTLLGDPFSFLRSGA